MRACAFVVTHDKKPLALADLLKFLQNERMPTWQLPERIELLDELPKSAGGKIMKNKLRELVADKVKAEASSSTA